MSSVKGRNTGRTIPSRRDRGSARPADHAGLLGERRRPRVADPRRDIRRLFAAMRSIVRVVPGASPAEREAVAQIDRRLGVLARAWSLTGGRTGDGRDGAVDLEFLVAEEMSSHRLPEGGRFRAHGGRVRLPSRLAWAVAIAVHELAIDALASGVLASDGGWIDIAWRLTDVGGTRLLLSWCERGRSKPAGAATRTGPDLSTLERLTLGDLKVPDAFDIRRGRLACLLEVRLGG